MQRVLADTDVAGYWVNDGNQALAALDREEGAIVIDVESDQALRWIARIRAERAATTIIAVTDDRVLGSAARHVGATEIVSRKVRGRHLLDLVARHHRMARAGQPSPRADDNGIIARSTAMQRVLESVGDAAQRCTGAIISGEAATGRELIARAIHARSRPGAPFVVSDCARVPPHQLEWELFGPQPIREVPAGGDSGHALEGFTKNSRLAQALGGTLFIRRIAEMPAPLQSRLARLHRDGHAVLVERGDVIAFDVQIIAAVDPSFEAAVTDGRVRRDLYERLAAARIDLPPLRERREDLPLLVAHMVQEVCRERRLPPKALDEAATALLSAASCGRL
jgi:DNA-binding NtrC family response regulator